MTPVERELEAGKKIHRLDAGGYLFRNAYVQLSTTRQLGYGVIGPIPWDRIVDWGMLKGLSLRAIDRLVDVVSRIDNDYVTKVNTRK